MASQDHMAAKSTVPVEPSAWTGGTVADGRSFVFVEHGGRGRQWSNLHVVERGLAVSLCGRRSRCGWQPCDVPPPRYEGDARWCWMCSRELLALLTDAVDDALARRPALRVVVGRGASMFRIGREYAR